MARILIICAALVMSAAAHARDLEQTYKKTFFAIGKNKFTAYLADDSDKREEGLMFIKSMPPEVGMLFIFDEEQPLAFWMKNTLIPLDVGFFDKKGVLVDLQEMKVAASLMRVDIPSYKSRKPAMFALEMNSGWFAKHKIKLGARLEIKGEIAAEVLSPQLSGLKSARH